MFLIVAFLVCVFFVLFVVFLLCVVFYVLCLACVFCLLGDVFFALPFGVCVMCCVVAFLFSFLLCLISRVLVRFFFV